VSVVIFRQEFVPGEQAATTVIMGNYPLMADTQ
jgi:hypothetical protein